MKDLPESWDAKSGTNIKWKAPLGSTSNGNPVVADGKIFLGTNNGNPRNPEITGDKGVLMCLRESDGKFLWQAVTDKLDGDSDWPEEGVCSSPAVEGKRLYYVSNRGELVCLDTEGFTDGRNDGPFQDEVLQGADRRRHHLEARHAEGPGRRRSSTWRLRRRSSGRTSSSSSHPTAATAATRRSSRRRRPASWRSTRTPARSCGRTTRRARTSCTASGARRRSAIVDGVTQAVFPGGDGWLYGFNARTGEKLWKFDLNPEGRRLAQDAQLRRLHAGLQRRPGVHERRAGPRPPERCRPHLLHQPGGAGDITESGRVWQYDKIGRSISTAAVADGLVYVADMKGVLHCLDVKTGKPYWTYDTMAPVWGSPLVADGKVYLGDQDGDVAVLKAGTELKKIAEIDMGDSVYSTPVPANGVLYVMTRSELFAIAAPATARASSGPLPSARD